MQLINANTPLIYTPPKIETYKIELKKIISAEHEEFILTKFGCTYLRCGIAIDRCTPRVHNLISCTLSTARSSRAPVDNRHSYLRNGPKLGRTL